MIQLHITHQTSKHELQETANRELQSLCNWFHENKLLL